jgi:hypothetical protein
MQFPYPSLMSQYEAVIVPSYLVSYIKSIIQQYSYQPQGYLPNFDMSNTFGIHDLLTSAIASSPSQIVPIVSQPVAPLPVPLVSQPAAPLVSQPAAPLVSQPVAPLISQPVELLVSQPAAPLVSKPVEPIVSKPDAPLVSQPVAPLVSQPISKSVLTNAKQDVVKKIEVIKKPRYCDHMVCLDWLISNCDDHACVYDHHYPTTFKTQYCKYWESGNCKFKVHECRYAHGKYDKHSNIKSEPSRYYSESFNSKNVQHQRSRSRSRERYVPSNPSQSLYFIDSRSKSVGELSEKNINYYRK